MLLAIDIGNTNTHLAHFRKNRIIKTFTCATKRKLSQAALRKFSSQLKNENAIVVSVVPAATRALEKELLRLTGRRPYIIGKNIKIPICSLYRNPLSLGQDRLVNAFAAAALYGAPAVIIGLGTAVTFDAVSKDKHHLGGMILPGLELALGSLSKHTALLPRVILENPRELLGRDTKNSILSGIVYGYAGLCDALTRKIKAKIGNNAAVIATGGNARLISRYSKEIKIVDPELTLKGLNIIYNTRT